MTISRRTVFASIAATPILMLMQGNALSRDGGNDGPRNRCDELLSQLRRLERRHRRAKTSGEKSEIQSEIDEVEAELVRLDC